MTIQEIDSNSEIFKHSVSEIIQHIESRKSEFGAYFVVGHPLHDLQDKYIAEYFGLSTDHRLAHVAMANGMLLSREVCFSPSVQEHLEDDSSIITGVSYRLSYPEII